MSTVSCSDASQPSSPLPPEPRRKQLVAALAVNQLSRHYRQRPLCKLAKAG